MRISLSQFGYVAFAIALVFAVGACSLTGGPASDGTTGEVGTMSLSLTDAPLDDSNVSGVFITITDVQYEQDGEWVSMDGFEPNNPYNLLDLTGGTSALLGELVLPAGQYEQIRFMLDAPAESEPNPSNPGAYISYKDDTADQPLFVPSAAQTGYKAVSEEAFTVPVNGDVSVTADFDARKSVVVAGASGMYLLKPTIRLVVDNQAGEIAGTVSDLTSGNRYTILAYSEESPYTSDEAQDPADGETRFPNAVSSFTVEPVDGETSAAYTLAYLAAGTYELYVAEYSDDGDGTYEYVGGNGSGEPFAGPADVEVTAGVTTTVEFSIAP